MKTTVENSARTAICPNNIKPGQLGYQCTTMIKRAIVRCTLEGKIIRIPARTFVELFWHRSYKPAKGSDAYAATEGDDVHVFRCAVAVAGQVWHFDADSVADLDNFVL